MPKIVYIPLDERPCNYSFPNLLTGQTDVNLVRPPLHLMGEKKKPGNTAQLWDWLAKESLDADGLILSIDTLVFGGIIPSRLHQLTLKECEELLSKLSGIKAFNPNVKIYAFNLIMRCPQYSSDDEEPDYYEDWGKEIFRYGELCHLISDSLITLERQKEWEALTAQLPSQHMVDYLARRKMNVGVNQLVLDYVSNGVIDFLIIPQDDSAPYGWTAMDQQTVREAIATHHLELNVYMYPGADEVGCTLLARMLNAFKGKRPLIYPVFSSIQGPTVTPLYEDRPLFETLKYQLLAAGGLMATNMQEADLVLFVNAPVEPMVEASSQERLSAAYQVNRNLLDFVEQLEYTIKKRALPCIVADVAFANGSDLTLIKLLKHKKILFSLAGYAGWNTSSNSLGTCIAQGVFYTIYGETQAHRNFLALRYVEDAGYCSHVRANVTDTNLPALGYNYFHVDGKKGVVANIVQDQLTSFIQAHVSDNENSIRIKECLLPWSRMFEVGLTVEAIKLAGNEKATD